VRTIFIGDIHGCLSELRTLVGRLQLKRRDRVICIGDLINKGPESAAVVRYVYNAGFECVRGNHDQSFLDYPKRPAYRKIRRELPTQVLEWYSELPLYIKGQGFLAVHAGIPPGCAVSKVTPRVLMNIRTWDGKGKYLNRSSDPPWYSLYVGKRKVIYGHWAAQGLRVNARTIGLDSGCAYGKQLSAYVLETEQLVQVQAQRVYEAIRG
jgi:serine/threonine protein phosphatase 1